MNKSVCITIFRRGGAYDLFYRGVATAVKSWRQSSVVSRSDSSQSGLRINRCFPQYSRTEADRLIESGRVTINGTPAKLGSRLQDTDVVLLDGTPVKWQELVGKQLSSKYPEGLHNDNGFVYIKYWKGIGVNVTTSPRDPDGILNTGHFKNVKMSPPPAVEGSDGAKKEEGDAVSRLLPVGRLDKASTGLLLLTSDARLPAWLLGANTGCSKVYEVCLDRQPTAAHLKSWSSGIALSTPSSSGKEMRSHSTLPCKVRLLAQPSTGAAAATASAPVATTATSSRGGAKEKTPLKGAAEPATQKTTAAPAAGGKGVWVEFTLKEGRNRQIRRMVHALGYSVKALHRTVFCGVTAGAGLRKPGEWAYLSDAELKLLQQRK